MTFFEAFRGFFGLPGQRRPREPLFSRAAWDEEEEEEEAAPPDFGFGTFELLLRDLGEALGSFGGAWAGPPRPFGGEPLLPGPSTGGTLRESMLKQPESPERGLGGPWRPFLGLEETPPAPPDLKKDQDLDSQVSSEGLGTLLTPSGSRTPHFFQSISVTTVTLPDGTLQQRRTVQDSRGHCRTMVTTRRSGEGAPGPQEDGGQRPEELLSRDPRLFAGSWLQPEELEDPSALLGGFFRHWFSGW